MGYTVWYGDDRQHKVVGNVTSVIIQGLTPNIDYNITVAAWNAISKGTESPPDTFKTDSRRQERLATARALTSETVLIDTTLEAMRGFVNCSVPSTQCRLGCKVPVNVTQLQPDTYYNLSCSMYDSASNINPCVYMNTSILTSESKYIKSLDTCVLIFMATCFQYILYLYVHVRVHLCVHFCHLPFVSTCDKDTVCMYCVKPSYVFDLFYSTHTGISWSCTKRT